MRSKPDYYTGSMSQGCNQWAHVCGSLRAVLLTAGCLLTVGLGNVRASMVDALIAYWPLDEGAGSHVEDVVGDHDGTLRGGAAWVEGKVGHGFSTCGSGYVTIPEHAALRPSQQVSLQAWVNVKDLDMWHGVAGNVQDNGSNESGYCLYTSNSGMGSVSP